MPRKKQKKWAFVRRTLGDPESKRASKNIPDIHGGCWEMLAAMVDYWKVVG
jgi:hypothetical protein